MGDTGRAGSRLCRRVVPLMSVVGSGIVVGVDGSAHADSALLWAWLEGQSLKSTLTAVYSGGSPASALESALYHEAGGQWPAEITDAVARLSASLLGEHAALVPVDAASPGDPAALGIRGAYVAGPIVPGLLEFVHNAQMLVVGRRGLGRLGRIFMGSVSAGLAREAQVPVTIVPAGWPTARPDAATDGGEALLDAAPMQGADGGSRTDRARVVVGVDGSSSSRTALVHGIEVARRTGAVLEAVACWQIMTVAPLPHGRGWAPPLEDYQKHVAEMLSTALAAALEEAGPLPDDSIRAIVEHAAPARGLLAHAFGAGRLIVGHRGLGGFDRLLLGSVSSQMIEHAPCPVTVIRAP